MNLITRSRLHYRSINETYWSHFKIAMHIAHQALKVMCFAFIHAVIPGWFQSNATHTLQKMNTFLETHGRKTTQKS